MNIKQRIRLTESQLHQVIKESVKRVLKEMDGERNACPYGCWDYERCKAEASKYNSKLEFKMGNRSAYQSANKHGWLDEFFGNSLKKSSNCWDYDRCKAEANKYKGRNEFTI